MKSKLRKPYDNEADGCARLLYISGPDLYSYIFVAREPKIYEIIKLLYETPGNPYSRDNIIVEEEDGRIRGLILAYPASDMNKLGRQLLKYIIGMIAIGGIFNFLKMMFRLKLNTYFPGTENDELFISNLAVFEDYRGRGIAVKLLDQAKKMALEKGLNKLSLYVEIDNSRAKSVYEKFGFQEVNKAVLPKKYNRYHLFGFYKMIKTIGKD